MEVTPYRRALAIIEWMHGPAWEDDNRLEFIAGHIREAEADAVRAAKDQREIDAAVAALRVDNADRQ